MSNDLAKPIPIVDRVSEKVRAAFVDLITDDEWKVLVEKELIAFRTDTSGQSPFKAMIQGELEKLIKARVIEILNSDELKASYSWISQHNNIEIGDALKQAIKDCVPELVAGLFQQVVGSAMINFKQQLRDQVNRGY